MRKRVSLILLFIVSVFYGIGQTNMTLDRDFLLPYQSEFNDKSNIQFTSVMPYDKEKTKPVLWHDSASGVEPVMNTNWYTGYRDLLFRGRDKEPSSGKVNINITSLEGGSGGYDVYAKKAMYDYFGGAHLDLKWGKKLSFSANYIGGDIVAPSFMDSIIKRYKVVPGMGYAYGTAAKGYSYQYWDGYLSYNIDSHFNFQIGKGKQFWGDGYRSLFLSDVSNSYPYFKITATIWHIQYVSMFTVMQDAEAPSGLVRDFHTKYGSFHYLTWNASPRCNFSLFEAITYDGDSGQYRRGPDPGYLNPIIFYQPVNYNIGDPDKSHLGAAFKIKVAKKEQFYGQILIDEFKLQYVFQRHGVPDGWWGNKQGLQVGFKAFDLFGVKNLAFQTEINYVRPFTYTARDPLQNFSNFNQPLADPEGANFIESASFLTYYHKNFLLQGSIVAYKYGGDSGSSDWGQNIFIIYTQHQKEFYNHVGQGISIYLATIGLKADYIISPKMNLKAEFAAYECIDKVAGTTISEPYVTLGIKTSLGNLYNDFR